VIDGASSIRAQVARFALRSRASSEAFSQGVRLATIGAVTFGDVAVDRLSAIVRDPAPHVVSLIATRGTLLGDCDCPDGAVDVCCHQVAAAHAVWATGRDQDHRAPADEPMTLEMWAGDCGVLLQGVRSCPDDHKGTMRCACGAEVLPQPARRD
jgi:uncharacterized Zn finger protein